MFELLDKCLKKQINKINIFLKINRNKKMFEKLNKNKKFIKKIKILKFHI